MRADLYVYYMHTYIRVNRVARAAGRMSSEEEQFPDARDWEKELQDLKEKVRVEKNVARKERKKKKLWEGEAGGSGKGKERKIDEE